MATYTTNLNLIKPAGDELAKISDINNNMDIIDTFAGNATSDNIGTFSSQTDLATALASEIAAMSNYTNKRVRFNLTSGSGSFAARHYYGTLSRSGASTGGTLLVTSANGMASGVVGTFINSEWDFGEIVKGKSNSSISSTISKYSGRSGTLDTNVCQKVGNVVNVGARIHTMSETASGNFFVIPEGYRPVVAARGTAFMQIQNVGAVMVICVIGTDGNVAIGYSSTATATAVGFSASYGV